MYYVLCDCNLSPTSALGAPAVMVNCYASGHKQCEWECFLSIVRVTLELWFLFHFLLSLWTFKEERHGLVVGLDTLGSWVRCTHRAWFDFEVYSISFASVYYAQLQISTTLLGRYLRWTGVPSRRVSIVLATWAWGILSGSDFSVLPTVLTYKHVLFLSLFICMQCMHPGWIRLSINAARECDLATLCLPGAYC